MVWPKVLRLTMEALVPTSYEDLFAHLDEVEADPQHERLNVDLVREAANNLGPSTPEQTTWKILAQGERLLNILQEDPKPLTRLLEKDITLIPFDQIKDSISPLKLEQGLQSSLPSIQVLCIAYICRAADTPSGAAWIGSNTSLVKCFITTWLATESTEVTDRATEALTLLLSVDHVHSKTVVKGQGTWGEASGHGLLWRRLFRDPEVYASFFHWTSSHSPAYSSKTKKDMQQVTLAQARLFDFLTRVAEIDWTDISQSHFPEIERRYSSPSNVEDEGSGGLLQYAALRMVDLSDPLMNMLRQDFLTRLLTVLEMGAEQQPVPTRLLEAIKEDLGDQVGGPATQSGLHL